MSRYAIGDIQGCNGELQALLSHLEFSADRDQLYFVGDLVNRGPASLDVLRFVRDLGDNAVVVLGNHDLHMLAVGYGVKRPKKSDTLDDILEADDCDDLLEWLRTRPLAHLHKRPDGGTDLMVHAGLVPQWSVDMALTRAREVERILRDNPLVMFECMYGDEPDRWSDDLTFNDRIRFTINVLTRLRVCNTEGRIDLKWKGKPPQSNSPWMAWFDVADRLSRNARVIFGHWSALGLVQRNGVVGLDSGCVWGGSLTAFDLDVERPPISLPCNGYQVPDD